MSFERGSIRSLFCILSSCLANCMVFSQTRSMITSSWSCMSAHIGADLHNEVRVRWNMVWKMCITAAAHMTVTCVWTCAKNHSWIFPIMIDLMTYSACSTRHWLTCASTTQWGWAQHIPIHFDICCTWSTTSFLLTNCVCSSHKHPHLIHVSVHVCLRWQQI